MKTKTKNDKTVKFNKEQRTPCTTLEKIGLLIIKIGSILLNTKIYKKYINNTIKKIETRNKKITKKIIK